MDNVHRPPAAAWLVDATDMVRLLRGEHDDPCAVLGMHPGAVAHEVIVRCLLPGARRVEVIERGSGAEAPQVRGVLERLDARGFFAGAIPAPLGRFRYRLRVTDASGTHDALDTHSAAAVREIDDPYAFPPWLGELDCHLLAEGEHWHIETRLGAHACELDGVAGVAFAVWAPNAQRVSVVGPFNGWDGRVHVMRRRAECGVWEIFLPDVSDGALYKFEVRTQAGEILLKSDPCAAQAEAAPGTASRVCAKRRFDWGDADWMARRAGPDGPNGLHMPLAIYEVHVGSWRRHPDGRAYTYDELADALIPYVLEMGFTHVELMPVSEHPFAGSWGYQPTALFAPSARWGEPDGLRRLIDRCHRAGIGVLLDWVPAHFPQDAHGLARFDGTCLYEHEDPRVGQHREWGTLVYNLGRREVANFLLGNALYWLREFHIDGLRVDAVASMLYLDYNRAAGQWRPNPFGGRENLEAVAFLRRFNELVHSAQAPAGAITLAEESTAWPMVTRPTYLGGLGFDYKWNMGWMNDTLAYMRHDPVHRRYHHGQLTFGLLYAFSEQFVLPLSHDEVVHGKGSLLGKMPGDAWQRLANLRLYLAFQTTQPGKKLLFMGGEFAQPGEWNHDQELAWPLLADPAHAGVQHAVRDLNRLYRELACLHRHDSDERGFRWIDCNDSEQSVLTWRRHGDDPNDFAVIACNFTPVPRHGYRVGVPVGGTYREVFNGDALAYGGSGLGNAGAVRSEPLPWHGQPHSLALTLPPLAALILLPPPA
ncbi:glycogen branching protein [Pandoraea thiooxydans]|uniref:1,4-alpha-glucan branching enzyme GlgB n=1 Tax=Pandoraea thiooxydans TaxID=445709 RepID=A0A0G3EN20_9BURK|nr:1,4-alpha-glucan branching protein GlgB [Pandoraea thiooxydans]AKJ68443.1 1,4-alpha-glucan branching enzyme [Pandoraea thiooxydans]APR95815.1 glycogen branching protein [Pandoraea thiooxydans]